MGWPQAGAPRGPPHLSPVMREQKQGSPGAEAVSYSPNLHCSSPLAQISFPQENTKMICLSKLHDSYLWPEVLFFPFFFLFFTHFQFLQPLQANFSEGTQPTQFLRTSHKTPGLSSRQKGKKRKFFLLLDPFHSFPVKEIWKCFKNIKYSESTETSLLPSVFLSFFLFFGGGSVFSSANFPSSILKRDKIPITI